MAIILSGLALILYETLAISAIIIPLIVIANFVRRLLSNSGLPSNLPWAGVGPDGGPLSRARANLRSFFGMKGLLDEGYAKVRIATVPTSRRLPAP